MGGLLFVTQAMLDSWAGQGKIDFVGNVMTLLGAEGGRSYALEPAVRFMKVLGADEDPNRLLHKVKSVSQLREMRAEPAEDSCILGDVAYEVQPGFLVEASALQAAATAPAAPRPPSPPPLPPVSAASPGKGAAVPPPSGEPRSRPLGSTPLPKDLEEKRKEAEALARFLLENLS
jgi:hypothetical protein